MTYYIIKSGMFDHGLYWIRYELPEGVNKAVQLSRADEDDYHGWNLFEYKKRGDDVFIGHANKSSVHFINNK